MEAAFSMQSAPTICYEDTSRVSPLRVGGYECLKRSAGVVGETKRDSSAWS
jgi:hypothetical protein